MQRNNALQIPAVVRDPAELEVEIATSITAGKHAMTMALAKIFTLHPDIDRLAVYIYGTSYDGKLLPEADDTGDWKDVRKEPTAFLTNRGKYPPSLLDGNEGIVPRDTFNVWPLPLTISDSPIINDAVEKGLQEAYMNTSNLLKLWKTNGAGSCGNYGHAEGFTRRYCVGLT
jgi:hypothetical protein